MARVIEYYYALASPWSYLGNDLLRRIAAEHDARIDPVIIDYDPVFTATGTIPLPGRPRVRKAYRLVELARWSRFRGVPLNPEPRFYRGETEEPDERQAALMVTAAKETGLDSLRLAHAVSRALWAEERFPFRPDELRAIAAAEGFDGDALLEAAARPQTADAYEAATRRAIDLDVFGMPFYRLDGEPFWGQDRLEFLERALRAGA
ncbi:MAG: 2-hydroxychromene-2-carboxylate isomerase [Immundisolibacterales bacterium]|nr:2-hydroxychromene-2-carboxylate isomerase [Immundisolibacterales bacterium]